MLNFIIKTCLVIWLVCFVWDKARGTFGINGGVGNQIASSVSNVFKKPSA
jgi:hypothetical protein